MGEADRQREPTPEPPPKPWKRCWFRHKWNQYTMECLAPNADGKYEPAELHVRACDRCGKVS